MEAISRARYVRLSSRKVGQVLTLISGKKVDAALQILKFTNKAAVPAVSKTIKSAAANCGKNIDLKQLVVKEAYVGQGPSMKRIRARAMGRGAQYKRKTCHITIKVATL